MLGTFSWRRVSQKGLNRNVTFAADSEIAKEGSLGSLGDKTLGKMSASPVCEITFPVAVDIRANMLFFLFLILAFDLYTPCTV